MATLPIAVENNHNEADVQRIADALAARVGAASMDEFGRTEAERTVVLSSKDAERINSEVETGKHDSYDEALAYVIERGLLEIDRVRKSQAKLAATKKLATETTLFTNMLAMNPKLIADADFVGKMMKQLAELSAKTK